MEHQFHYGKKFYLDKSTGYWISTATPKIRAHVWVWKVNYGDIAKACHVHHIDGNKSNNEISNLQLLTVKEHVNRHFTAERRAAAVAHFDKIRPLTKSWHRSKEGISWHRKNGVEAWRNRPCIEIKCVNCQKSVITKTYHQNVCSNACKSALRRNLRKDNEERECVICNSKFSVNKYAKTKTCSPNCRHVLRSQKYRRV